MGTTLEPLHNQVHSWLNNPELNHTIDGTNEVIEAKIIHPNSSVFECNTFSSFREIARSVECKGTIENFKHCPVNDGKWDGEAGNSKWEPDGEYIPQKSNPENQSWKEILDEYDIDGIDFQEGEPDFSEISKGDVEIDDFSDDRSDNFDKADAELAKQRGCTPEEVRTWRKEHKHTWHECKDMRTMQKVPSKIHNNITHSGGIAEAKKGNHNNEQ